MRKSHGDHLSTSISQGCLPQEDPRSCQNARIRAGPGRPGARGGQAEPASYGPGAERAEARRLMAGDNANEFNNLLAIIFVLASATIRPASPDQMPIVSRSSRRNPRPARAMRLEVSSSHTGVARSARAGARQMPARRRLGRLEGRRRNGADLDRGRAALSWRSRSATPDAPRARSPEGAETAGQIVEAFCGSRQANPAERADRSYPRLAARRSWASLPDLTSRRTPVDRKNWGGAQRTRGRQGGRSGRDDRDLTCQRASGCSERAPTARPRADASRRAWRPGPC